MFVLHRMALSSPSSAHSLFTSSLRLSTSPKPSYPHTLLSLHSRLRTLASVYKRLSEREIRVFALYKKSTGFSSSSAVATDSTEMAVVATADKASDEVPNEKIVLPTNKSSETLLRIRHTCAHVMAMAVQKLFPGAKVTIGPWIENGFYYDFDMEPLADKDLKRIKKEMGTEFIS